MATKIRQSSLDNSVIIGNTELAEAANDSDILLIYDASSGSLKKVLKSNIAPASPVVSSVSPTNVKGDGTDKTFTITGTGFTAGSNARLIGNDGSVIDFATVVRNSATQITATINADNLSASQDPYGVQVINGTGLAGIKTGQINFDAQPVFITAAGSVGSFPDGARTGIRIVINANDPDSAGNVTYELQSGSLPSGLSLTSEGSEGGIAVISGNASAVGTDTTSNFVLRAVDAASNTTSRSFSITILAPVNQSFTSSGTFAVPTGLSNIGAVLVVAGGGAGAYGGHCTGGGGAGGLVYMPNYPVTPGGTITVTVGAGGLTTTAPAAAGQDSAFGSPGDPGLGQGGVLTAKGGGATGGGAGGSGGGGGGPGGNSAGPATQPTQSGNSGAYGFGHNGGATFGGGGGGSGRGAGGGGAGAAGCNSHPTNHGGAAGAGKSYTIADGTTPVGYAGGGTGGGANTPIGADTVASFGGGIGGSSQPTSPGGTTGQPGAANRGGGGGGGGCGSGTPGAGGAGGKGVVIISY